MQFIFSLAIIFKLVIMTSCFPLLRSDCLVGAPFPSFNLFLLQVVLISVFYRVVLLFYSKHINWTEVKAIAANNTAAMT